MAMTDRPKAEIKQVRANGRRPTRGLFYETYDYVPGSPAPIYTFSVEDRNGCKSVHKIFMEAPSEYDAAIAIVGSWDYWLLLCRTAVLRPYIDAMREEKAIKEAGECFAVLLEQAREGNVTAASKVFDHHTKGKKGRPTKQQVRQAAVKREQDESIIEHANSVIREIRQ